MHCFTLFLCQGGGVSGIYATFATYRVLTFNKHIYGSQKSPKADLEGKRTTWLLFGFILVLAAMFVAFEWTERDKQIVTETGIVEPILRKK